MANTQRLVPYLAAAMKNIRGVVDRMNIRFHHIDDSGPGNISLKDIERYYQNRDELLEELLQLDEILKKAEKIHQKEENKNI